MPPIEAAAGPLGLAISKWHLAVQGGAVVLSIVLGWVVYRMSLIIGSKDEKLAGVYEDRITQQREDADTEKETTRMVVEAMTRNTDAQAKVHEGQKALESRMEALERSVKG